MVELTERRKGQLLPFLHLLVIQDSHDADKPRCQNRTPVEALNGVFPRCSSDRKNPTLSGDYFSQTKRMVPEQIQNCSWYSECTQIGSSSCASPILSIFVYRHYRLHLQNFARLVAPAKLVATRPLPAHAHSSPPLAWPTHGHLSSAHG